MENQKEDEKCFCVSCMYYYWKDKTCRINPPVYSSEYGVWPIIRYEAFWCSKWRSKENPTCAKCRHWNYDSEDFGNCERFAPIPFRADGNGIEAVWPITEKSFGCGDLEPIFP